MHDDLTREQLDRLSLEARVRYKAIRKVRALAEVTVENGATQPEEDNATEKGRAIILKHDLTFEEVVGDEPPPVPPPAPPPFQQTNRPATFVTFVHATVNGVPTIIQAPGPFVTYGPTPTR